MPRGCDPETMLQRALAYPGVAPAGSFVLGRDGPVSLEARRAQARAATPGVTALLAYGSNAAPEVLRRKLGPETRVVALAARVSDCDVVYSAHLASYGAVPATLWPSPGTELQCHVLLVRAAELELLDETEPNYERLLMPVASATMGWGTWDRSLWAYRSRHGALRLGGSALAVGAVRASGRRLVASEQAQVLARVRDRLAAELSLRDFVARAVQDAELRAAWSARLRADALGVGGSRG